MLKDVQLLIKDCREYWRHTLEEYDIKDIPLIFISVYDLCIVNTKDDPLMTTGFNVITESIEDVPDNKLTVECLEVKTYMTYESLYEMIIKNNLDYRKVFNDLKFSMKHEIDHIIDINKSYVGKPLLELKKLF